MTILDLSFIEDRVVRMVLAGRSTSEIATELGAETRFVEWHVARAMRKLEAAAAVHRRLRRSLPGETSSGRLVTREGQPRV
jgi:DNA-binding NarL/FixJ family response regulator